MKGGVKGEDLKPHGLFTVYASVAVQAWLLRQVG